MHIVVPGDAKPLILQSLRTLHPDFKVPFGTDFSGLNTLMAHSKLAKDPEILESLLQVLLCPYLGPRRNALKVLAELEHPEAADHLAYGSLRIHPLLHTDQAMTSGWSDAESLWHAELFDGRHFAMFLEEQLSELGTFHGDLLGKIRVPDAEVLLRPSLTKDEKRSAFAAYALALRGDQEGFGVLKDALDCRRYAPLCIRGLCLGQDKSAIEHIRPYTNPGLEYFHTGKAETDEFFNSRLARLAREAIELLSAGHDEKLDIFKSFYLKTAKDLLAEQSKSIETKKITHARHMQRRQSAIAQEKHEEALQRIAKIKPEADFEYFTFGFLLSPVVVPCAADFIDRFLDTEQRRMLADLQAKGVEKTFASIDKKAGEIGVTGGWIGWWTVPWRGLQPTSDDFSHTGSSPYYIRGFELKYDTEDFISASVDWIINPQKHYLGISRYDYLFSEILL